MKTFLCSGRLGDFFHQLYVVKTICKNLEEKAHIVIGDDWIHEKIYHGQCDFWSPLEDAVEEIFPAPQQQVPPAGAPMVEQPSPAPAAPAGGAIPQVEAGGPPDIMSLLSSLTAGGEANASVRTIRRR